TFADGSDGSVIVNPKNADAARAAMEKLIGTEADFDLEPKPDYNARKQWKIKGYPAKPGGGGFGKQWKDNSPSIEAQNAVNNAVKLVTEMQRFLPAASDLDIAMRLVEEYAPRMHALTQRLKPSAGAPTPAGEANLLPSRSTSAGAADTPKTWDGVEASIKASGESEPQGEGRSGSPETSEVGSGDTPVANGSASDPTSELEELWAEALARDLTKARVVAILKKAQQPITGWEEVDARQLESILRPMRERSNA